MADERWASLARELAAVVREQDALTARQYELEQRLREMLAEDERAPLVRVPEWTAERRRQTVEPGHGASTRLISSSAPLSELSAEVPCPGFWCPHQQAGMPHTHTHTADGVVTEYLRK